MGLARRDDLRHTYGDYRTWRDDGSYELIDGIAYATVPSPSVAHQSILVAMVGQLEQALKYGPCRLFIAPLDVRLPHQHEADDDIDTVVQPDLMVVCDPSKIDERGICGAPDWIVEVISPATAAHDQIVKRALYERHGVREYWLVHPTDRVVTIYRLAQGRYGLPEVAELLGFTKIATLPGIAIDWTAVLHRIG